MPVYAEGRVEHQKRTQAATTLWPFGFVFGVQLGSLEKRKRGVPGTCRAASYYVIQFSVKQFRQDTFFLVNRVENQNEPKRPQSAGRLGSFWFSTQPSADTGTDHQSQICFFFIQKMTF